MANQKPAAEQSFFKRLFRTDAFTIFQAIVWSLLICALLVVFFDKRVEETMGYLFARPSDFFNAAWDAFSSFFIALVRGAFFDWEATSFARMLYPLTESLVFATPLILSGLAVTVAFQAGLFNIGVQGQIILGGIFATIVGVNLHLPVGLAVLVAMLAALLGGALWGAIPGILKARLGANEVIVTIMLNTIALLLVSRMLQLPILIGKGLPSKSANINENAWYPHLLGTGFRLNLGFLVALVAAYLVWWLLSRSTFGFELRAVGANPDAAATAGMNTRKVTVLTMVISGALGGLAATAPVLGTEHFLTGSSQGTYGFDGITVALLGRSSPLGVVLAALLFGALNAGGSTMQAAADIPIDIVTITQAVIVLLIAASEGRKYFRMKRELKATAKTQDASTKAPPEPQEATPATSGMTGQEGTK
ncbi:ABC transporter permease [Boudabousia liubingyangii]|uniref:ABC transporter permease n=1 Tax=Boudabousia liubingyangii TaxID=1921764 RepID=A0A1Q5PJQ5_9ACTO|nr:ABC transporter permease [Boudabousia liubingyangii]OKL46164.1 ABC transporter permease [Boudabousia liubingyangii]